MAAPKKRGARSSKKASESKAKKNPFPRRIYAIASPHSIGGVSMFEADSMINAETVANFDSEQSTVERAVRMLDEAGFDVLSANTAMINFCGSRTAYERAFDTKLIAEERDVIKPGGVEDTATFFDTDDDSLSGFVDCSTTAFGDVLEGVAIEEPYYPMASSIPPTVAGWHLTVPDGVATALNASRAHRSGRTGKGVKVAMVDSGWYRHPFFVDRGYRAQRAILGPGAANPDDDESGHGTGESANVFATAPDIELLPVKAANASGALVNVTAAFNEAVALSPDIITNSWGASVEHGPLSAARQAQAAAIAAAVAAGIVVCFSAGNGHFGFPGQHPDVISVGGVFRDIDGSLQASNYASGFVSNIYPNRQSPDVCGMVGMQPGANYIMLPVQDGDQIDVGKANGSPPTPPDGTTTNDGWALFSGTSASCPQVAGVVALMKEACPRLTPAEIRAILRSTAVDITSGVSHGNTGGTTGPGVDTATGHGLVDAARAVAIARLRCLTVRPIVIPRPPILPITLPRLPLTPVRPPLVPLRPLLPPLIPVRPFLPRPPFSDAPEDQTAGQAEAPPDPFQQAQGGALSAEEVAYLEELVMETGPDLLEEL